MEDATFLFVKISSPKGVDFYKEHLEIIKKYGYVDFCRIGKRKINTSRFSDKLFIKDSVRNGGKLYEAKLSEQSGKNQFPTYYKKSDKEKSTIIRICSLEEVELAKINEEYCAISGKSIVDVVRASVPSFYITRRK